MSTNKRLLLVILLAVGIPLIGAGIIGGSLVIQSLRKPDVPATTVVDNFLTATFTRHDEAAALAMVTAAGRRGGSHTRKLMYNYLSSDVGKIVELHWNGLRELVTNDKAIVICTATVMVYSNGQILDLSRGWTFTLLPVHRQWLIDDWS
jgi:hypothetical protein